jgi:electron transport complex protein RnfA
MATLTELLLVAFAAALVKNLVLYHVVGLCPLLGSSRRVESAWAMGCAVTLVLALASTLTYVLNDQLLRPAAPLATAMVKLVAAGSEPVDLSFLGYLVYVVCIAASVQLVTLAVRKLLPSTYQSLGIYLQPLTANCVVLFVCLQIMEQTVRVEQTAAWGLGRALVFGVAGGLGFTLASVVMAGMREELELADVPVALRGPAITLIATGVLALAFTGFTGVEAGLGKLLLDANAR